MTGAAVRAGSCQVTAPSCTHTEHPTEIISVFWLVRKRMDRYDHGRAEVSKTNDG